MGTGVSDETRRAGGRADRDPRRVALISTAIATHIGLDADTAEGAGFAASIHDIGKRPQ